MGRRNIVTRDDLPDVDATELTDRDYQALARFRHALRVFLRFSERAARDAGVTPAQHQLLLAIRGFPGHAPPATGDIAEMLQQVHHSVVELIDRAEAIGLVTRSVDPDDGRRRLIGLTPRGEEILAALSSLHRTELRRFRVEMHQVLGDLG
jgi:DNA-binding MarR family transcriptional regulator